MIWVTADSHVGHRNIVRGISNWDDKSGCRPFKYLAEHNRAIIDGINDNVHPDGDTLFVLGDWNFGGVHNIWWFRKQLDVKDIRFVLGNHDKQIRQNRTIEIPGEDVERYQELTGKGLRLSGGKFTTPCQELFTWVKEFHQQRIDGTLVNMFHYSLRVWDRSHHGSYMLYGHSHDTLTPYGRSMDVGFDAAHRILGEWRPFKWSEIDQILSNRSIEKPDHHNEDTNE